MAIIIRKSGFTFEEWDSKSREEKNTQLYSVQPRHLREVVKSIDEGVTVGDLIRLVAEDGFLNSFISGYSSCPVDEFYQALKTCTPASSGLHYAYVSSVTELENHKKKSYQEAGYSVGNYYRFNGCGPQGPQPEWMSDPTQGFTPEQVDPNHVIDNWSVSESPIEQLATLPLKIVRKGIHTFYDYTLPKDERYKAVHSFDDVLSYISLLDYLDAVFYDISFSGGPKERSEFVESLAAMCKEIETGEAKTVPFGFKDEDDDDL